MPKKFCVGHYERRLPNIDNSPPMLMNGVYSKLIPLTQDKFAVVDHSDYLHFMQWPWAAVLSPKMGSYYAVRKDRTPDGKRINVFMHREVLGLKYGDPRQGDHALHNTLDNRRIVDDKENLRLADYVEQGSNKSHRRNSKSGYKGVSFSKASGKWRAQIMVRGKKKHLGLFPTPELAYAAYCAAAVELHGKFAWTELTNQSTVG